MIKNIVELEIIFTRKYRLAANMICNLKYSIPKQIPIVFRKASDYDYYFIIIKLANKFEEKINCVGEYKTFSISITKEVKSIDKNGKKLQK